MLGLELAAALVLFQVINDHFVVVDSSALT
jgi:hypothetical protein